MIRTSLDYTPAEHPAISFDLNINHVGERVASNDELNKVAAYTQFDVGLRYRFSLRDADGIFRLRLINATNVLSWKINSHNSLGLTDERHVTAQLLIDLGK
jgi:hypothetical protein